MTNQTWSNIAVVGAGALGSYFGGLLARAGNKVTLVGRAGHVDAIRQNGLRLQSHGTDERIPVSATTDIASVRNAGLILFCVKSLDTETAAAAMAPHLPPDAIVLSLQNGVDNPERIGLHLGNQVVPVLVYAGANIPAPGTVRHTGGGRIVIGQLKTFRAGAELDRGLLAGVAALFADAGIAVKVSDDIEADLWIKLLMNCTYNAISALGRSAYGRMVATPEVNAVMREAASEVAAVAKARGIRLPDDIAETAMKLADAMPQTMSSTAQDIAKGRPTEIAYLNGYVMRQGEKLGIATPVNRTLNALIELLEQSGPGG
ncbi:MAG: 2-dehydropantoate 2-reductase [Xanthobacteraceae bacterium]|nr:2-dehydropantoate 2-reductase [Xanthobacteraceae bacterium]